MLAGLLLLGSILPGPTTPAAPLRYRIDFKSEQVVDLSSAGMDPQTSATVFTGFITVTMSDTAGGKIAHVVIDSITGASLPPMPMEPPTPASAKGIFYHVYVVNGKIKGPYKPSAENLFASWLQAGVDNLFPGAHAGRKAGDTWVDTVGTESASGPMKSKTSSVATWKVVSSSGDEMVLDASAVGTLAGEGEQAGMKLQQNGKLTGSRALKASLSGPIASGVVSSTQDVIVTTEALPEPIPVKAKNEIVITRLP